jgi:hypothetical protein
MSNLSAGFRQDQRCADLHAQRLGLEELIEGAMVDGD